MHAVYSNHKNQVPAGFWTLIIGKDSIYKNPVLKQSLGFAEHEFEDGIDQWKTHVYADDWNEIKDNFLHYLQSEMIGPFMQELRMMHKGGVVFQILFVGQITAWDIEGVPSQIAGSHLDITAQRHLESEYNHRKNLSTITSEADNTGKELKFESENQLLATFLKYCPALVAMVDKESKYIAVSDAWKNQFNLAGVDIEAKSHYEIFPDTPPIWKHYHQRAMDGETIKMDEDSTVGKDGSTEWMQWEIRPWYDKNGHVGGIMTFVMMISEKHAVKETLIQAKDQAEQSSEIKSRFLSVMSHEMRTPLNGVIGFINLLLQDPRPDQLENMSVLKFSAENLLVLINNVLDFSKLDAGKVELEEAGFDLQSLLENVTASLRLEARSKNLELELFSDSLIPLYLTGDSARLGQILINLLSNAIKFTPAGKVSMIVTVISQHDQSTTIDFAIEDTGIGISPELQDKIFETFSQADAHTTRRYGGTGLGLTISKRLVELMGSSIRLESQPGQGSMFSFEITFENFEKAVPNFVDERNLGSKVLENAKILIAEDYPINVLVVKKFLQQWQCVPSVAENGLVALEMVQKDDFDLILMDLQMPVMDGYEATAKIRSLPDEKYKHVPIIALTAASIVNRKTKIFESGMNGLISKPFAPRQLQELLVLHLRKKRFY